MYSEYHVCDLLSPPAAVRGRLESARFNAMTSVAALGFGDVPPEVFLAAFDLVDDGGWVAFTIKEDFLEGRGPLRLLRPDRPDALRRAARGARAAPLPAPPRRARPPLHYVAMVGVKHG